MDNEKKEEERKNQRKERRDLSVSLIFTYPLETGIANSIVGFKVQRFLAYWGHEVYLK